MGSKKQTTTQTRTVDPETSANQQTISSNALGDSTSYTAQNRTVAPNAGYDNVRSGLDNLVNRNNAGATGALTSAYNSNSAQGMAGPNFSRASLSRFENPYQDMVIGSGLDKINRQQSMQRVNDNASAATAGAFGGARHGIADAERSRAYDSNRNDYIGTQLSQGYDKALSQYNTDYGQQLQAGEFNNKAAAQNYGQGADYASRYSALGQNDVDNQNTYNQTAFNLANRETDNARANVENEAEEGRYEQNYAMDQYKDQATVNSSLANAEGTQTTTEPGQSVWGTVAGGLGSALGAYARSDERAKENVSDLNPEKVLGAFSKIPTKSFDYKAEFAGPYEGRRDGFMAQDYETAFREKSPVDGDGVKMVDIPQVMGRLVAAVKGLDARTRDLKKGAA